MLLLQRLMDSKSKILLLEKLLARPAAFSVSELSRLASLPKSTVSGIVADWGDAGLVVSEQQGRNKLVRLNQRFCLLADLKKIFKKTGDFQRPLFGALESLKTLKSPKVKAVVVFGSRARKDFSHHSDLDVLIGLESRNDEFAEKIVEDFVKATAGTGIRFSPLLLDKAELRSRWAEKDRLVRNIFSEGKVLKGGRWLERIQAAS